MEADAALAQLAHRLGQVGLLLLGVGEATVGDALPLGDGQGLVLVACQLGSRVAGLGKLKALRLAAVVDKHGAAAIADDLASGVQQALVLACGEGASAADGAQGSACLGRGGWRLNDRRCDGRRLGGCGRCGDGDRLSLGRRLHSSGRRDSGPQARTAVGAEVTIRLSSAVRTNHRRPPTLVEASCQA